MTTQRDSTSRVDDDQLRIVSHRLQVTGSATSRPGEPRVRKGNGSPQKESGTGREAESRQVLRQIVLVDRDVDALREVAIALRDHYDFHVTISGNEALALLRTGEIDAIVVGQTLYSSTGLNVLAEARRRAPHTQRILLANVVEATGIERDSSSARPFRILPRPCSPQNLLELLESLEESFGQASESQATAPTAPSPTTSSPPPKPLQPQAKAVAPAWPVTPPQPLTISASPQHAPHQGDYEHVILETPPELPRRRQRSDAANGLLAEKLPVVVFTDNVEFYQAVCGALQDRHDIRLATQIERAVEMAEMGACPILITDRAGTQTELQRISIAIRSSEPSLVTIASGSHSDGLELRKLINTPALHSFLAKPLSAPLVRLAVESAKRQYIQSKAPPEIFAEPPQERPLKPHAVAQAAPQPGVYRPMQSFDQNLDIEDRFDFKRLIPYAGAAALAIAVLASGVWYWNYRSQSNAEVSVLIDAELNLAQRAYNAGDFVAPENANALYFYRRVLKRDPSQAEALQGIENITERLVDRIETQLTDDKVEAAAESLALLKELRPDHKRLSFLEGQVNKATGYQQSQRLAAQSAEMARVEAAKMSAAQARMLEGRANEERNAGQSSGSGVGLISNATQRMQAVNGWLNTGRQRLAQGKLVTPDADSAEHYFRLAERADPNNTAVDQGLREIGSRLMNDARDALSRQQIDAARRRLAEATKFAPDPSAVARMQAEIDTAAGANVRGNFLKLALQRTRENSLFEPTQDSAKYYLSQLQRLDADGPEVQQATRAIALKLIDNANQATAQRQFNIAVRLLDEARRFGYTGQELRDADSRLQLARNPPPPVAAAAPAPTPPKVIKSVAAKFPEDAMTAGVSGWVDVGFKINAAGDVYDAQAMASNPAGPYASKFERAAVAAISQYKFERRPITETQEQSMVVRVQFKIQ